MCHNSSLHLHLFSLKHIPGLARSINASTWLRFYDRISDRACAQSSLCSLGCKSIVCSPWNWVVRSLQMRLCLLAWTSLVGVEILDKEAREGVEVAIIYHQAMLPLLSFCQRITSILLCSIHRCPGLGFKMATFFTLAWLFRAQTDLRALNLFPKYLLMVIAHSIKTSLVRHGQNAAVSTRLWASNQNIPVGLTGSFLFFLAKCGHNAYGAECSEHTKYKSAVTQERRVGCRTNVWWWPGCNKSSENYVLRNIREICEYLS